MLQILETRPCHAKENMRMDAELLDHLDRSPGPILHLYAWKKDSITHGYFIKPHEHLDMEEIERRNIEVAKRPTGGGIVFHTWDLAFSFLMPVDHPDFSLNTLENYRFVNEIVKKAVAELFQEHDMDLTKTDYASKTDENYFCMARPTKYDVMLNGRKVAGSAQRRKKTGYLHQGTISLAFPREELLTSVLLSKKNVVEAMNHFSFTPLARGWTRHELVELRYQMKGLLIKHFQEALS